MGIELKIDQKRKRMEDRSEEEKEEEEEIRGLGSWKEYK